jgi:hypothetical protein
LQLEQLEYKEIKVTLVLLDLTVQMDDELQTELKL